MAVLFIGAGTGVPITTGSATVSKTGCTAGNLIILHYLVHNGTDDVTRSNVTNITNLIGGNNSINPILVNRDVGTGGTTAKHSFCAGRATANGTCSVDLTVGGSGGDVFARVYEFSGAFAGSADDGIGLFENEGAVGQSDGQTNTTLADRSITPTSSGDLAVSLISIAGDQTLGAFTGETGGDWTEAVDQFNSATGATGTLQIQTAQLTGTGVINGGTMTITSSPWGVLAFGIVPAAAPGQTVLPDADLDAGGWLNEVGGSSPLFSKVNDSSDATFITDTAA